MKVRSTILNLVLAASLMAAVARAQATGAATATAVGSPTVTVTQFVEPSPTNQGECHLHDDHWHCELEGEEGHDHAHGEEGHDHAHGEEGHDHAHGEEGHDHAHDEELASSDSHAGHDHSGHSHAGHSHGPSAEYGCGLAPLEDYGMGIHIGAIFILLAASLAGCLIPEVMRWFRSKQGVQGGPGSNVTDQGFGRRTSYIIFALRFFGGGILLSTAFIHLVAHALTYFSNECVGTLIYEATAPAIMMAAVWVMLVINFLVLRPIRMRAANAALAAQEHSRSANSDEDVRAGEKQSSESDAESLWSEQRRSQNKLDESELLTLEAGIIVHSIVIGVTIGTSSGPGWIPFLIAILWHQFCEGLALASRIVLLPQLSTLKIWVMYLAFCLTTPIGIAIGIGVRQSYNGNDRATLLSIGILTSISAGILLYSSFIQVIAYDFFHDKRMQNIAWTRAISAVVFFTLGAIVMSILGYWA